MQDVEAEVQQLVREFTTKLTAIVKRTATDAIVDALGRTGAAARVSRTSRAVTTAPKPAHVAASKPSRKRGRPSKRSPEEIAATLDRIVAYVKEHPNVRSEQVRKELQLEKPVALESLRRLREAKTIKMKGTKNAATYSVA